MANLFSVGLDNHFTPDPDDEIIEDHSSTFALGSAGANEGDEAYLLKVVERASEPHQKHKDQATAAQLHVQAAAARRSNSSGRIRKVGLALHLCPSGAGRVGN